jgi:hypothetical protein
MQKLNHQNLAMSSFGKPLPGRSPRARIQGKGKASFCEQKEAKKLY